MSFEVGLIPRFAPVNVGLVSSRKDEESALLDYRIAGVLGDLRPLPNGVSEKDAVGLLKERNGYRDEFVQDLKRQVKQNERSDFIDWMKSRTLSPEVREIAKASLRSNQNVNRIPTLHSSSVDVLPNDDLGKTIFTYPLCGCLVSMVVSEDSYGKRTGTLCHYPPYALLEHLEDLRESIYSKHLNRSVACNVSTVLFVPAYKQVNYPSGEVEWLLKEPVAVELLKTLIKNKLGNEIPIIVEPYEIDDGALIGMDGGALYLKVEPKGKGNCFFKSWFNKVELSLH